MLPPLRFLPLIKRLRWGGTRLAGRLGKSIGTATDAAESWEIADHGSDQSVVSSGSYAGWTLSQILRQHRTELLGANASQTVFPLLVKFLDAQDRLSLQVHPNDAQAIRYSAVDNGKTEAWHIIEASPGSQIFAGLKPGVTRADLQFALEAGTLPDCVHSFEAVAGDSFLIPAGTVHAIGEGVLLAEIQQTSDITFRLYDWGRLGADGRPRPLHPVEALECLDFNRGPVVPQIPRSIAGISENRVEELVDSEYFAIWRHQGAFRWTLRPAGRFHILMVLSGQVTLTTDSVTEHLQIGDTILIPASCGDCVIAPGDDCTVLETFVP